MTNNHIHSEFAANINIDFDENNNMVITSDQSNGVYTIEKKEPHLMKRHISSMDHRNISVDDKILQSALTVAIIYL